MIRFSKYHGCGNSFIIVREEGLPAGFAKASYPALACAICDGNTGVGADGLILVREKPALEMVFYNCDGSRAPMCGNGIRCFAHYCLTEGVCSDASYKVKTLAGDMIVTVACQEPFRAQINMGKPVFAPEAIGVDHDGADFLNRTLTLKDGTCYTVNSLFMGTVHTVVFIDGCQAMDIPGVGEEICNHPTFREKTNVNFVRILNDHTLEMKTYERGVGMTLACGTGACASVVAANLQGLCGRKAEVRLALGSLTIERKDDGNVYMEGPSVKIADGMFYEKGE